MTHYIVKIPTRCVVGEPELHPTSYQDAAEARRRARDLALAHQNRVVRIDDVVTVYCIYAVIGPCGADEALRKAKEEEPYVSMRKDHNTPHRRVYVGDRK